MLNYLKRLIGIREPKFNKPTVNGLLPEYDTDRKRENVNVLLQQIENNKIKAGIKAEALRWLHEWENAPSVKIDNTEFKNCIFIVSPFIDCIVIYDEETAEYAECDLYKLVHEEFVKLRGITHSDCEY